MKFSYKVLYFLLICTTHLFGIPENSHPICHAIINSTSTPQPDHNQNLAISVQQTTQHMLSKMQAATLAYLDSQQPQPTPQAEQQSHKQQVKAQHHKHEFGVDETKLKQLFSMSYEQLESWILQSINLKRDQAINIWNGYCLKRITGSDKKNSGRQRIHEKFDKQKQLKYEQQAAELQHQHKLQQMYQLEIPDLHELDSEVQQRWTLRQQALQQTKQESFKEYRKTYRLDPLASGYLMALNINHLEYEQFTGTVLQHHLHRETLSIIEQTAQTQQSLSYQSSTLKQVVLLNDTSIIANQSSLFDWTTHLNDINYGMLGFICNMSKSGLRSLSVAAEQFSSSALNAPALFAQGIADIANLLTTIIYHSEEPAQEIILEQEHLHNQINQQHLLYSHILDTIAQATQHWYQTKTAQEKADDIIKATVDMGANIIIPDLILQKCALALGYMAGNLKNLRSLECVANLLEEELLFQTALEKSYSSKQIEQVAQSEISKHLAHDWHIEECKNPITGKVEKIRAKQATNNRIKDQKVIQQSIAMAEQHFSISPEKITTVTEFAQKNRFIEVEIEGILQKVEVDWEHILLPHIQPDIKYNFAQKQKELKNIKISGWHHGLWKEFEKNGTITIVNKLEKQGCTYLEFNWGFNNNHKKPEMKTFFPESWNYQKIYKEIKEFLNVHNKKLINTNNAIIRKNTRSGINLEAKLFKQSKNRWKLNTVFVHENYFKGIL